MSTCSIYRLYIIYIISSQSFNFFLRSTLILYTSFDILKRLNGYSVPDNNNNNNNINTYIIHLKFYTSVYVKCGGLWKIIIRTHLQNRIVYSIRDFIMDYLSDGRNTNRFVD